MPPPDTHHIPTSCHCKPVTDVTGAAIRPPHRRPLPVSRFQLPFPTRKRSGRSRSSKAMKFFYRWDTNVLFTATVRLISEDLMLAKIVRMMVSAFLPLTSGSRSCSRASTNSSMTPERVVGSKL